MHMRMHMYALTMSRIASNVPVSRTGPVTCDKRLLILAKRRVFDKPEDLAAKHQCHAKHCVIRV